MQNSQKNSIIYGKGVNLDNFNYVDWQPDKGIKQYVKTCGEREYVVGDEALVDTVTDGVGKTVYVLSTPVITDLSDILADDNFIEVQGGGSVVAENGYGYAVPTEIIYQLKEGEESE